MASTIVPTANQIKSTQLHLSRRDLWRSFRMNGVRYVRMPSSDGRREYTVRADGRGCSCPAYQKYNYKMCSHMLAAREAANHDALTDWLSSGVAPIEPKPAEPKPRRTYADLFPSCDQPGCTDDREPNESYCWRHALVDAF